MHPEVQSASGTMSVITYSAGLWLGYRYLVWVLVLDACQGQVIVWYRIHYCIQCRTNLCPVPCLALHLVLG